MSKALWIFSFFFFQLEDTAWRHYLSQTSTWHKQEGGIFINNLFTRNVPSWGNEETKYFKKKLHCCPQQTILKSLFIFNLVNYITCACINVYFSFFVSKLCQVKVRGSANTNFKKIGTMGKILDKN